MARWVSGILTWRIPGFLIISPINFHPEKLALKISLPLKPTSRPSAVSLGTGIFSRQVPLLLGMSLIC